MTSTLPSLTETEVNALILASEGRAVSYVDEPEWFCGQRKNTHMSRDGMAATKFGDPGTCQALAYSFRDHCRDYLQAKADVQYLAGFIVRIESEQDAEYKRKSPRKRRLANLAEELRIVRRDAENSERRMREIAAKHFRGYEGRLLFS